VINKGVELNAAGVETNLMIETSGHGAMRENYNLDDGAYIAVKIIIEAVRRQIDGSGGISTLLGELKEPLEEREVRLKITAAEFKSYGGTVIDAFKVGPARYCSRHVFSSSSQARWRSTSARLSKSPLRHNA